MADKLVQARLVAIARKIKAISKDRQADKYHYRGIDDIYNAVAPLFREEGIFMTSEILEQSVIRAPETTTRYNKQEVRILTHAVLRCRFRYWGESGDSVSTDAMGEGIDYGGDKACNKAMSNAQKYALFQTFTVPTEEHYAKDDARPVDSEAYANPPKTKPVYATDEQMNTIEALAEERGMSRGKLAQVLKRFGAKGWKSLPLAEVANVISFLSTEPEPATEDATHAE